MSLMPPLGLNPLGATPPAGALAQRRAGALWDDMARALLLCLIILAALTFRNYGISTDEEVQHIYGKKLLSFYLSGFTDRSAFHFKDLYLYGGLFDLVTALVVPISPFEEYETRHLLCALVGVLGIAGCWRYARLLAGPRAGFLAAALLALSGVYYGAMFNNTKDVPFAAGMVWTLYFATRIIGQMPSPRQSAVLKFGLALGLTLSIRVGGVLAGFYLAVALALYVVLVAWQGGLRPAFGVVRRAVPPLLPAIPLAYAVMALFWPWAVQKPLNPLEALRVVSHFPIDIQTLFMGQMVSSAAPPALYLPVYLGVKLPEAVLLGTLAAVVLAALWVVRGGWRSVDGAFGAVRWVPLALAAFLPIILFMLMRPSVYNGIRHFLFVAPPMAVLAGIAFDRLWSGAEALGRRTGQAYGAAAIAVAVLYAWQLGAMHPNQYVYYNQFAGGLKGAEGRFELDYWGNSQHEALAELVALVERENGGKAPPRQYTLSVCGNTLAVRFELPPWLKLVNGTGLDWRKADFFMAFTQVKQCPTLLGGQPIIEIAADDVPLTIVKDRRPPVAEIPTE
ncbi:glycosyltransferase family 39 protein [Azospirillum argentinense]